jgi:ATP-binding cassette, subfamily C, bacteriocin exporter
MSESNFIDTIKGITEIKSFNWQHDYSEKNRTIYSDFQEKAVILGKIKVKLNLIIGFTGSVYLILVLILGAREVMSSAMTQGAFMAILSISSSLIPSVLNLALISIPANEVKVAINRMFEFTQIEPESGIRDTEESNLIINKMELSDISFRFPGHRLLLEKINIVIEKGKIVSLIGESGCGKSTLNSVALRFYQPESGDILINDSIKMNEIDLEGWRTKIALIPQEIHIFNGTILQNLITDINEKNLRKLQSLIVDFGLEPFYKSFPSGLMTLVGEEGINLSGGQKQLLAFTRALIRVPDILIIDEGTSNMDRGTEAFIMDLLIRLKSEMGIFMISHRLNMIRSLCDYIYVLEGRTISARGTHEELMQGSNLYSRLWKDFE